VNSGCRRRREGHTNGAGLPRCQRRRARRSIGKHGTGAYNRADTYGRFAKIIDQYRHRIPRSLHLLIGKSQGYRGKPQRVVGTLRNAVAVRGGATVSQQGYLVRAWLTDGAAVIENVVDPEPSAIESVLG